MELYTLVLVLATLHSTLSVKNPSKHWKFCKRSDPKINECLMSAVHGVENDLLHGNQYFGTPSLDPLHLTKMELNQGASKSPVAINLAFKEVDIIGLSSWQIEKVKAGYPYDMNSKTGLWARIHFKSPVSLVGDYKISGKVILLPITGEGKCNFTFDTLDAELSFDGKTYERNDKSYYRVDNIAVKIETSRLRLHMENLFNGNQALADNMNKFINENWQEILKEIEGTLSQGLGEAFKLISNQVFKKIPIDVFIPN